MHQSQRDRTHAYLNQEGISNALFADAVSIAWLTGYAPPVYLGPHPTTGAPALLWYAEGAWTLIIPEGNKALAKGLCRRRGKQRSHLCRKSLQLTQVCARANSSARLPSFGRGRLRRAASWGSSRRM